MEDNPYSSFWQAIRQEIAEQRIPANATGTVTSAVPLKIKMGNIELDQNDVKMNALLRGDDALQLGDTVLMTPRGDQQLFYVLCKVVGA